MNAEERSVHQDDMLKALTRKGVKIFNDYNAYSNANDKFIANLMLRKKGINVPPAILIPTDVSKDFLKDIFNQWKVVVVKPRSNIGAEGIIKFNEFEQFYDFYRAVENFYGSFYIEKFIPFENQDVRVEVFDGKVIGAGFTRIKTHSYKTNVKAGGMVTYIPASDSAKQLALDAVDALNITTSIVDMVYDIEEQQLCVLEVNPFLGVFYGAHLDSDLNKHTQTKQVYDYFKEMDELKVEIIVTHISALVADKVVEV